MSMRRNNCYQIEHFTVSRDFSVPLVTIFIKIFVLMRPDVISSWWTHSSLPKLFAIPKLPLTVKKFSLARNCFRIWWNPSSPFFALQPGRRVPGDEEERSHGMHVTEGCKGEKSCFKKLPKWHIEKSRVGEKKKENKNKKSEWKQKLFMMEIG